jgi:hypothetical protein
MSQTLQERIAAALARVTHPRTGAALAIESPLAHDLAEFLASR